jgi:hypothetical protein
MNACQLDTKKYLTEQSDKVARAKATKFKAQMSSQKYGDRIEYTFSGETAYSAALGFYGSFNKAFPGVINKPRSVQKNSIITVPIDINSVNRVIELSARYKSGKAETISDSYIYQNDPELINFMKDKGDMMLEDKEDISVDPKQVLKLMSEEGQTEGIQKLSADLLRVLQESEKTSDLHDLSVFYVDQETLDLFNTNQVESPIGMYMASDNTIYVSKKLTVKQMERTFLHELAHAITERKMEADPKIKAEFEKLYEKAKSVLKNDPEVYQYRLSNVSEFIAGAFNDTKFMKKLAAIESVNGKSPNLLTQFLDLVKQFLGLKDVSLLDDIYYMVEQTAFQETRKVDTPPSYILRAEIAEEEILDDPNLKKLWSKQVDSINNRIKELETISGGKNREEVKKRISILNNSLRDLEGKVTYNALYTVANRDLQTAKYLLSKDNITSFDLNEALRIIEDLEGFDVSLEKSPLPAEFKKEKAVIREKVIKLGVEFKDKFESQILKIAKSQGVNMTYEQLTKAVEDMGMTGKLIYSPEYSHIPIMRIAASVLNQYQNTVREEMAKFNEKEAAIKKAFKDFDLNSIFENRHLISEYSDAYYNAEFEKNSAVRDAHAPIKKLKDEGLEVPSNLWAAYYKALNDRFDWYRQNHRYVLSEESKARYQNDFETQKALLTTEEGVDYEALAKWEAEHSPYKNEVGYLGANDTFFITAKEAPSVYNRWFEYFTAVPVDDWKNSKYEAVKDNEVYKFFRDSYIDAFSKIPHKAFMDVGSYHKLVRSMEFDMTENSFRFRGLWNGLGDTVKNWYSTKLDLNDINGIDNSVRDAYGRPKTTIKIPDINKVEGNNPYELLKKFYEMATSYEHKVHAAPITDLLYYQLSNIPALQTGITGSMIKKILTGDPAVVEKGLVNAMANLKYKTDSVLSEKTRLDEEKVSDLTDEEKAELKRKTDEWVKNGAKGPAPTVRKTSYVKVFDSISDFTRLNLIGLKPFSAISNIIMGISSNYLYAARKKEFDDEHLDKATKIMFQSMFKFWTKPLGKGRVVTDEAKKVTMLAGKFGIVTNLYEEQGQLGKSGDVAKAFVELMYKFQESGEYLIHTQIMMAMMFKQKVTDLNGKERSLWDAYKVVTDKSGNDVLTWDEKTFGPAPEWNSRELLDADGLNISKLNDFERSIKKVRIDTQGDYQNALLIKSTWYGRMAMIFRTWIPSALRQRFGKEIDGEFKGRYRSLASAYKSTREYSDSWYGAFAKFAGKTTGLALAKMLNIGPLKYLGFKALSEKASAAYEEDLKSMGMSELDIENMRMNVRELQFVLFCLILASALKSLADDDDDPNLVFLTNLSQRTYQDLTFFILPPSTLSIIKDPIPIKKTIEDATDIITASSNYILNPEKDVYQKGRRKGKSKTAKEIEDLIPVWSAINSTQGTFDQVFNSQSYKYTK